MTQSLPIDSLRDEFEATIQQRPVVITAPTGTGKSTGVPRWLLSLWRGRDGPILVVQPRRVAARAVAARVAELEGVALGKEVGYRVRDDDQSDNDTRLLVVTPGIVLSRPALLDQARMVVLDELHERRLDTDLIFALLARKSAPFVAMSATMDGEKVARTVGGAHLHVEARTYPVDIQYIDKSPDLPSARNLETRIVRALEHLPSGEGDILVFLPGKGEIVRVADAIPSREFEVVPLHGGLSLSEQARALAPANRRRVILSTNVAETSLTIPGVRTVIDSGLVRRTSYHNGRTYLALSNIALDSADQRAGRAGRTAPGHCIRLWGSQARLAQETPPEIHREQLGPLVMTCAALDVAPERLPFLDAPKDYALEDARARLFELGALSKSADGRADTLSDTGRQLFGLPLDPWLSRVLVEAKKTGCLQDAIDLVALLEQPTSSNLARLAPEEELESSTCDAEALVWMMREGRGESAGERHGLKEARSTAKRLRRALGAEAEQPRGGPSDRQLLIETLLRADPVCAHVARTRKRRIAFSNGGTEVEVAQKCRVSRLIASDNPADKVEALVVLETHGVSSGGDHRLLITLASPVPLSLLARIELGQVAVKQAKIPKSGPHKGQIIVSWERSYAGRVIASGEDVPQGEFARRAVVDLFERGALHPRARKEAERRLSRLSLAHSLGRNPDFSHFRDCAQPAPLGQWLLAHLESLGVESCNDLELLSEEDFLPPDVPAELAPQLDERFPLEVDLGDCLYSVAYDLEGRQATLSIVRGARKSPPPPNYLPRFEGLRVFVEAGGSFHPIRR